MQSNWVCSGRYRLFSSIRHSRKKEGKDEHDLCQPHVKERLMSLAARPDCVFVVASPPCSSFSAMQFNRTEGGAKLCRDIDHPRGFILPNGEVNPTAKAGNEVLDACIAIIRAAAAHGAGYWLENPVSRGPGPYAIAGREKHASMWEYPEVKALLQETGGECITIDQCMLSEPDTKNTTSARKTTVFACDAHLWPHLVKQFNGLKCDGTHFHTAVMQPRRSDGSWCSKESAYYPLST